MAHGRNTTYVRYQLAATASGPITLQLKPLVSDRLCKETRRRQVGEAPAVQAEPDGCVVRVGGPQPLRLWLPGGGFEPQPDIYWRVLYRREREGGRDYVEDLFSPGTLSATLPPGGTATLILSAEPPERIEPETEVAWRLEWRRRGELEQRAGLPPDDQLGRTLALAADAFIVGRPSLAGGRAVLAGYPGLSEQRRDALIGLPGLLLTTGRAAEARTLLTAWLAEVEDGLLPARLNEATGAPEGIAADATLWLFPALRAYLAAADDRALLTDAWSTLTAIIAAHQRGAGHGIDIDPADGLLRLVGSDAALTWMDARVGEPVTPRRGKPVEVNALWYNALRQMEAWARERDPAAADNYARAAEWVEASFNQRFWYAPGGYLSDVVDGADDEELALRPNQILAVGLPFPALARERWRPVVDAVTDHLLTPFGLRTLSPVDPRYTGWYAGDWRHQETARHQGTVVPWMIGPYCDAYDRVYRDRAALRERLKRFERALRLAGLGTISELFDGDAPHSPQGAIASAAGVGEALRAWRLARQAAGEPA
jgi:predicted glycogen debranching enzyme